MNGKNSPHYKVSDHHILDYDIM